MSNKMIKNIDLNSVNLSELGIKLFYEHGVSLTHIIDPNYDSYYANAANQMMNEIGMDISNMKVVNKSEYYGKEEQSEEGRLVSILKLSDDYGNNKFVKAMCITDSYGYHGEGVSASDYMWIEVIPKEKTVIDYDYVES